MEPHFQPWQPFDPGAPDGARAPELDGTGENGRVVVLEVAPGARQDGWAGRAALALAGDWAESGQKVILADLGLDAPFLPPSSGEESREGVVDLLLYGASVRRVTRSSPGGAYYSIPSGAWTSDVDGVLSHHRWDSLLEGFRQAGVTLVVLLSVEAVGRARVDRHATHRLRLIGTEGDEPEEANREAYLAVLGPEGSDDRGAEPAAPPAVVGDASVIEDPPEAVSPSSVTDSRAAPDPSADEDDLQTAAGPATGSGAVASPGARAEGEREEVAPSGKKDNNSSEKRGRATSGRGERREEPPARSRLFVLLVLLVLVLAALGVAVWSGNFPVPGLDLSFLAGVPATVQSVVIPSK